MIKNSTVINYTTNPSYSASSIFMERHFKLTWVFQ